MQFVLTWSQLTRLSFILLAVFLTACASPSATVWKQNRDDNAGRYALENDVPELEPLDLSAVKPVIPVAITRTEAGNKSPYQVNGRSYRVLPTEEGYEAVGRASWYGRKFHGHLTSNGEIYDMFQLSAAHRNLPIPSFARVTNLENGRSVVVRVNDRGPFHSERIIDLSYAAAVMLDYAAEGTARVKVEAIVPESAESLQWVEKPEPTTRQPETLAETAAEAPDIDALIRERGLIERGEGEAYLQVGAFSSLDSARNLLARLSLLTSVPAFIRSEDADGGQALHRVRLGPLERGADLDGLIRSIIEADLGTPFRVTQ